MLIKLGDVVGQASGSLRSNTYSHNRFGSYIRNRSIPVNPQSARQTSVRTLMQSLTNLWSQQVSSSQRAEWNLYGANVGIINRLGDTVYLTGLNHYIRSNVARIIAGLDRVDAGPSIFALPETDIICAATYTADDQKMSVVFDDTMGWCDLANCALLVYQGHPVSPSRLFFNGPFRFVDAIEGSVGSPPTSPTLVTAAFGLQTGERCYHRFRICLADGRLSGFFRLGSSIVLAT